jgi:hypothetical protein
MHLPLHRHAPKVVSRGRSDIDALRAGAGAEAWIPELGRSCFHFHREVDFLSAACASVALGRRVTSHLSMELARGHCVVVADEAASWTRDSVPESTCAQAGMRVNSPTCFAKDASIGIPIRFCTIWTRDVLSAASTSRTPLIISKRIEPRDQISNLVLLETLCAGA